MHGKFETTHRNISWNPIASGHFAWICPQHMKVAFSVHVTKSDARFLTWLDYLHIYDMRLK